MLVTRRAFTATLSLTGLAALAGLSPLRLIADAMRAECSPDVAPSRRRCRTWRSVPPTPR